MFLPKLGVGLPKLGIGGLFITAAIIIVVTLGLTFLVRHLNKKHPGIEKKVWFQIIIGLIYAGISFVATVFAWADKGNSNIRDSAIWIAGLAFGPIAGLVSGITGCGLRLLFTFVFNLQGTLDLTEAVDVQKAAIAVACALGTLLAGLFGAFARKFIYKSRDKVYAFSGLEIGVATEVLHILMIFITFLVAHDINPYVNMANAVWVVKTALTIMVPFNAVVIFVALLGDCLIRDRGHLSVIKTKSLANQFHFSMLIAVLLSYLLSLFLTYEIFTNYDQIARRGYTPAIVLVSGMVSFVVLAVIFVIVRLVVERKIQRPINRIKDALSEITDGKLDTVVNVRDNDEFSKLSDDINHTVNKLNELITEAEERNKADILMARDIQLGVLPVSFPISERMEIYASMEPAKEVGGDFYDFFYIDMERFCFVIADVSGKGIPAAMFMMRAKSVIKSLASDGLEANEILNQANVELCQGNDKQMFVTVYIAIVNLNTGHVWTSNGGHDLPLVHNANGDDYLLGTKSFVLGGIPICKYKTVEFDLKPGDMIYVYTDGITEAQNINNDFFGLNRLKESFIKYSQLTPKDVCLGVKADVAEFVGEADQFDDMTMVAFRYLGKRVNDRLSVNATLENHDLVMDYVDSFMDDIDAKTKNKIGICLDEIYTNIVSYGYAGRDKVGTVEVIVSRSPKSISITFLDDGNPFNPLEREDPDVTLSAEERGVGGLGIFIVKKVMDDVQYQRTATQNYLKIVKKF